MSSTPDDDTTDADSIEERVERIRRLRGWSDDKPKAAPVEEAPVHTARPTRSLWLTYVDPSRGRIQVEVEREHFEIGSGDSAHLRILEPSLSARHCRISWDDGGYRVRDMRSRQGTFVGDVAVPLSHPLAHGDVLRLGDVTFDVALRARGEAPSEPEEEAVAPEPTAFVSSDDAEFALEAPGEAGPRADASRPIASFKLVYSDPWGQATEVPIQRGQKIVIGRSSKCDRTIVDPGISSRHAVVSWAEDADGRTPGERVVIEDLGSTNGTCVNGERTMRAELNDGDLVHFGRYPLRLMAIMGASAGADGEADWAGADEADVGTPSYRLLFADERGVVHCVSLSADRRTYAFGPDEEFGDDPATVTWDEGALVIDAAPGTSFVHHGKVESSAVLYNGDVVSWVSRGQTTFRVRVVRGVPVAEHAARSPKVAAVIAAWAQKLFDLDADLEVLFIDPEHMDTDGSNCRVELCIWGDGVAQLDIKRGDEGTTHHGRVRKELILALADALTRAGFPDTHQLGDAGGDHEGEPELRAFRGDLSADIYLSRRLVQRSGAYAEVRDLMRAVAAQMWPA